MSQKFPNMNFTIGEGSIYTNISGLVNTGDGLSLVNLDYHQSVSEHHLNLVSKLAYFKDLDDVDSFNISRISGGK